MPTYSLCFLALFSNLLVIMCTSEETNRVILQPYEISQRKIKMA